MVHFEFEFTPPGLFNRGSKNKNETRNFNPVPLFQDLMPIRTTKSQIKAVIRYNINSQSSIQTFMIKQAAASIWHQATKK